MFLLFLRNIVLYGQIPYGFHSRRAVTEAGNDLAVEAGQITGRYRDTETRLALDATDS